MDLSKYTLKFGEFSPLTTAGDRGFYILLLTDKKTKEVTKLGKLKKDRESYSTDKIGNKYRTVYHFMWDVAIEKVVGRAVRICNFPRSLKIDEYELIGISSSTRKPTLRSLKEMLEKL